MPERIRCVFLRPDRSTVSWVQQQSPFLLAGSIKLRVPVLEPVLTLPRVPMLAQLEARCPSATAGSTSQSWMAFEGCSGIGLQPPSSC